MTTFPRSFLRVNEIMALKMNSASKPLFTEGTLEQFDVQMNHQVNSGGPRLVAHLAKVQAFVFSSQFFQTLKTISRIIFLKSVINFVLPQNPFTHGFAIKLEIHDT